MALNYFAGWSVQELEVELRRAQSDLAAGSSLTSGGTGEVNSQSQVDKSPDERVAMLLRALSKLDPERYPPGSSVATRATKIVFSQSQSY